MKVEILEAKHIVPHPKNPRRIKETDQATKDLADSIVEQGQLTPCTVRVHPTMKGKYEMLDGHRRMAAAKVAGDSDLYCVIRTSCDDKEAVSILVTQNNQREDLTAVQEGRIVQVLLDTGYTTEDAAEKLGRSRSWVARRARLSELSKPWRAMADGPVKGSTVHLWSFSTLEAIALLSQEAQLQLLKDDEWIVESQPDAHDLTRIAANYLKTFSKTVFDPNDENLLPKAGSCVACSKRASCRPGLFDGCEDPEEGRIPKGDRCLDVTCWDKKREAAIKLKIAELKKKHGGKLYLITYDWNKEKHPGHVFISWGSGWQIEKKKKKGYSPGIVVDGDDAGLERWVKFSKSKATSHHLASKAKTPDGGATSLKDRRANLKRRRQARAIVHLLEDILARRKKPAKDGGLKRPLFFRLLVLIRAMGYETPEPHGYRPDIWKVRDSVTSATKRGKTEAVLSEYFWSYILDFVTSWLTNISPGEVTSTVAKFAKRTAELIGDDWDAYMVIAEEEIPEPKSWAKLNADGTPKTPKAN